MPSHKTFNIAVTFWSDGDGIAEVICDELNALGHQVIPWNIRNELSRNAEMVISFGPYGPFMLVVNKLRRASHQPVLAHWNTEGIPDLRLPWPLVSKLSAIRSWLGRLHYRQDFIGRLFAHQPLMKIHSRMKRFSYVGDYYYAYRQGWLDVFADSSDVYGRLHSRNGLPTVMVYWGGTRRWFDDLGLTRDIDVLWMGKAGSNRRRNLLDELRHGFERQGISFYCADGVEHPFVFGNERTRLLNRAKISVNLTRTWYDDTYLRFAIVAPNRSLIVSEPMLSHCPLFEPGYHYVAAPIDKLVDTVAYYLKNDRERNHIVENAYQLATGPLHFRNSMATLVHAMEERLQKRNRSCV